MTNDERLDFACRIATFELEMWRPHFSELGCLYQSSPGIYYVGAAVESSIFGKFSTDRGPWKSTRKYITAHLQATIDSLETGITVPSPDDSSKRNILSFFQQLRDTLEQLTHLDISDNTCRPVLYHDDLQSGNILVTDDDLRRIVGIVDWEAASLVPLWFAVKASKMFAYYPQGSFSYKRREDVPERHLMYYEGFAFENDGLVDPLPALLKKYQSMLSAIDGYELALSERESLRILFGFVRTGYSSIAALKKRYLELRDAWPKVDSGAFKNLDRFLEEISGNEGM
jgi:hypothetical protein